MSKDLVSGCSSPDIREKDKILLRCFSNYEEYLEYLRVFYCENWCSLTWQDLSEEQKEDEIDLAYAEYFAGMATDDTSCSCCDGTDLGCSKCPSCYLSGDDDDLAEEVYTKDRSSRALNRKMAWLARKHNLKVGIVLSKKSLKLLSEEQRLCRTSATFYKREKVQLIVSELPDVDEAQNIHNGNFEYQAQILTHAYRTHKKFVSKGSNWFKRHANHHDDVSGNNVSAKDSSSEKATSDDKVNTLKPHTSYVNREFQISAIPSIFVHQALVAHNKMSFMPVLVSCTFPAVLPPLSKQRHSLGFF